ASSTPNTPTGASGPMNSRPKTIRSRSVSARRRPKWLPAGEPRASFLEERRDPFAEVGAAVARRDEVGVLTCGELPMRRESMKHCLRSANRQRRVRGDRGDQLLDGLIDDGRL